MDLFKQLEDKKKGLMNDQEMRDYIMSEFVNSGFITVHQWRNFVDYLQIMIKRQLEQAIAEIEKRDKEVDNAIDFLSSYPIWTKIYHKEDGDTEEIPEELYPILDNFLVMIKKVLKKQLKSQQLKVEVSESEKIVRGTPRVDCQIREGKLESHDASALERIPSDISNLLQKQRQEILDKIGYKIFSEDEQKSNNVWYKKGWDDSAKRINKELQQLNQPKTEK